MTYSKPVCTNLQLANGILLANGLKPCPDSKLRVEGTMPSHSSKPKALAGDPGLATAGGTLRLRSGQAAGATVVFLQPVNARGRCRKGAGPGR
jgi:hypothetical protein